MISDRVSRLVNRLEGRLDGRAILVGDAIGAGYACDATSHKGTRPEAVFRPRDTQDVATILSACNELLQPLVVQGGRTGLSGGARALPGEVSLSLERLTGVESLDTAGSRIAAWAGTPLEIVQNAADEANLMFGVDIGARGTSTIGGNIATNAGGIRVLRYGMYRAQVLGLETVLADGTVLSSLRGLPKNNSGYDLNQLFIGSEGTLGVVTRACLRLHPKPRSEMNAFLALPSLAAAQTLLEKLRAQTGLGNLLSAFEVIFPAVYEGAIALSGSQPPVPLGAGMYALVEIQGQNPEEDADRFATTLMDACEIGLVDDVVISQSLRDYRALWAIRERASEFIFSLDRLIGFDIGIPLAGMRDFLDSATYAVSAIDVDAEFYVFGHLGDGNLHYIVRTHSPDAICETVLKCVATAGGTIAAEHGIGLDKTKWLHLTRSNVEITTMRRLKAALDPNFILNPGRIFQTPPSVSAIM